MQVSGGFNMEGIVKKSRSHDALSYKDSSDKLVTHSESIKISHHARKPKMCPEI